MRSLPDHSHIAFHARSWEGPLWSRRFPTMDESCFFGYPINDVSEVRLSDVDLNAR